MSKQPVVLITGVSSGIGRDTAEYFARRGFRVFGTLRRAATAPVVNGIEIISMDVRDDASVAAGVEQVLASGGRIDVLVNNAGITSAGAFEETTMVEARAVIETNFFGALRLTRAVLATMRRQGGGRIIHVGSLGSFLPMPYQAMYAASKHALKGFSDTLDHEVRGFGVRSILVAPGYIRTEISHNATLVSQPLPVYDEQRYRTGKALDARIEEGDDSMRVAEVIFKAATVANPRMMYLAGRGARTFHFAWWLLPASLFAIGLRRHFGLK